MGSLETVNGDHLEQKPVLVIGAGISGMALARLLTRHSIPCIVFEASPREQVWNTGMTLKDWVWEPLLEELPEETLEALKEAVATDRLLGGRGMIDGTIRDNATGVTLMAPKPGKAGAEEGAVGQFRADRDALRDWFSEGGVNIRYGHRLSGFEGEAGNVKASFENGTEYDGSLLVASDGLNSFVRQKLLPHIKPAVLPVVALHGDVRFTHEEFLKTIRPHMGPTNILAGVGDGFNTPLTIARVTPTHVDLDWSYSRSPRPGRDPLFDPRRGRLAPEDIPREFLDEIAAKKLAPPFSLALNVPTIKKAEVWNLLSRSVFIPRSALDKALRGHGVVFVGDAAHGMPMFGGEGGNHALLDGIELARRLRECATMNGPRDSRLELEASVAAFYDGAYPRCQDAVRRCRQRFGLLHRPISDWRKLAELSKMRGEE